MFVNIDPFQITVQFLYTMRAYPMFSGGMEMEHQHSVHWGINPPQKHHPTLSWQAPP